MPRDRVTTRQAIAAALALLIAVQLVAVAQDLSASTTTPDGAYSDAQAERGAKVFERSCVSCHTVAEHTGAKFTARWNGTDLGELIEYIATAMPQTDPGSLAREEYASIIAYWLRETGYKPGQSDLPTDTEKLKQIKIVTPAM